MTQLVLNIRGTNGSGKSTLARAFLPTNLHGGPDGGPVDLNWYDAPTKKDPLRRLRVEGYVRTLSIKPIEMWAEPREVYVGVVGPYWTACGGLDGVPSFAVQHAAISHMLEMRAGDQTQIGFVIAEGVLASTVYGSWGAYADALKLGRWPVARQPVDFAFCYMSTPIEVCLERIKERQRAAGKERPIKEEMVRDKVKAILATRERALTSGHRVYDLPPENPAAAVKDIMRGSEVYRVG